MARVDTSLPPIKQGIQTVVVGKKGSRAVPIDLVERILADLKAGAVDEFLRGAFLGGLMMKGIEGAEARLAEAFDPGLLQDPSALADAICHDAPEPIRLLSRRLLKKEELSREEARSLGRFMLSDEAGEGARGLAASILRVRYETDDEWSGLLEALHDGIPKTFKTPPPEGKPVIQLSEPFNGVSRSYLITPLLAHAFQQRGYRAVNLVGRSPGPKFDLNLRDLYRDLEAPFVNDNESLGGTPPPFGWAIDLERVAPGVDRWVDRRIQLIKRPFLATLERFVNVAGARILLASAFHPPYLEKMVTIGESGGYPGIIVVGRGLEGCLSCSLSRSFELLCAARLADGSYERKPFSFPPPEKTGDKLPKERTSGAPSAEENTRLVRRFAESGSSGNPAFDQRVERTVAAFEEAREWVESRIGKWICGAESDCVEVF